MAANISLKQLKVFIAITQHDTLTAASEALFLSKAAVSMALSELEKQLGHSLFDRVNNRLVLNQEGQKTTATGRRAIASRSGYRPAV